MSDRGKSADARSSGPAEGQAVGCGRPVLVTGASRGLGRGIAVELARAGFSVVVNYLGNETAAAETVRLCEAARPTAGSASRGQRFLAVQADVSRAEDRERLVDAAFQEFEELYGLVNNAAMSPRERLDITEASIESFEEVLGTNLTGPYFLTQLVVRRWLAADAATVRNRSGRDQQGGDPPDPRHHVVFITSISASTVSTNRGEYCVAKAGLAMGAELWAARLAGEGINVYDVRPGIMETDMTAGVQEKYSRLIGEGVVPQRRWGRPSDIGRMVRSLMSGDFPFSTGAVIHADGGFKISRL
ncbi:MAG: 3-ketoacyl-ACP reductase [bacterium]